MKLLQSLKKIYDSSVLYKVGEKISSAYANSVIFSLNRAGELDHTLSNSFVIRDHKGKEYSVMSRILPAMRKCADKLTRISCRDFAALLSLFLISTAIRNGMDGNYTAAIACAVCVAVILPLFFAKNSVISLFAGSFIGRFFELETKDTPAKQNPAVLSLIALLAMIGGMFIPSPFSILLPLLPVAVLMITYLKPISFICLIMISLPLFGTSVCIVLCVLLAISQWLQRFYGTIQKTKIDYIDILLAIYIVLCVISSLFSFAIGDSLRVSLMWIILFSAVFIVIRNINTIKDLTLVVSWLLGGALIASAIGLYQYLSGQVDTTWTDTSLFENLSIRIYSTFANPNVFGEFLLLIIPLAAGLGLYYKNIKHKVACFAVMILSLVALALTYSRGCYVGIVVTVIVFLWMYNKKILGALLVIGTPIGIMMLPQNIIDRILSMVNFADTSTSYRLKIYEGTLEILKTYWPSGLGIGEDAFNHVYPHFGLQGIVAPHSHSLFLQLMTGFGIAGLLYFLTLMFVYHRNIISLTKRYGQKTGTRILLIVFGSILSGFLVQSIFDYTWYNYRVYFLFWIVVGLGFATYKIFRKEGKKHVEDSALHQ